MLKFISTAFLCLFSCGVLAQAYRPLMLTDTTAYARPWGNDVNVATGCASLVAPCATIDGALSVFERLDLNGKTATVDACDGITNILYSHGFTIPAMVGQTRGADQLRVVGAPGNTNVCRIVALSGYSISMGSTQSAAYVVGFWLDQTYNTDHNGDGQDMVSIGRGEFHFSDLTFSNNVNPWGGVVLSAPNAIAVAHKSGAMLGYTINGDQVQKTAWFGAGTASMYVPSGCGGLRKGMIPTGPGVPIGSIQVEYCSGQTVVLSAALTAQGTGVSIGFVYGGNAHVDVANGALFQLATDGGQSPFTIYMTGTLAYYEALFRAYKGGRLDLGAVYANGAVYARSVRAQKGSIVSFGVNSQSGGYPSMPGSAPECDATSVCW